MPTDAQTSKNKISALEIYTIGHSNVSVSRIVELLKLFNIQTLVDVRSSPYSQYNPQFNKEQLDHSIRTSGLVYKYAGDLLGGRPKDPTCYQDSIIPEGHADYLHLVNYPIVMTKDFFLIGIDQILNLAHEGRVAVMCSEEDPAICHRHHLIGRYLTSQGVNVLHIRGSGDIVKDQYLPNLSDEPPAEQLSLF